MGKLSTILVILFFSATSAYGQMLKYEVVKGNKKLGDMTVERSAYNNEIEYQIESKVIFRLLFSFTIDHKSKSFYKDNILQRESAISRLNGSTQKSSVIIKKGNSYSLTLNDITSVEKGSITYSVAAMYYQEPEPNQKVYSPQFAKYLSVEKIGDHVYKLESPDGLNIYTYMNGICTEVKVSRDFAKFYFRMTPETLRAVKNIKDAIVTGN